MSGFNMDDYVPVNERIAAFYEKHPEGSLQSEIVDMTEDRVTVKAYAYRTPDDQRPGTGLSSEPIPGRTTFTQGSELENAETSAWGRAIAALGFEVKRGIASREEMRRQQPQDGERVQRGGARKPATTRSAALQRTPAEQALLDDLLAVPGMTRSKMTLLADAVGIPHGQHATADQLRAMLERATTPGAGVPTVSPAGGGGSSVPPPPTTTPASGGQGDQAVVSAPGTESAVASPPPSAPAPTLDDVLAVTGGELLPPKPGTDEYKRLPAPEKAAAKAYWQKQGVTT